MSISSVSHIALSSTDLRKAEDYYCRLFNLQVAFRETETSEGWRRLPDDSNWDAAELAGIKIQMVMLYREGLALGLENTPVVQTPGSLSHIGLLVDEIELARFRGLMSEFNCRVVHDFENTLVFDDKFGVRWEPSLLEYANPSQIGNRPDRYLNI